jgi:hypothetical protein
LEIEQVGPELNKLGNIVWSVELIEMILLAGRASFPIWKYPITLSPTNCEEGANEQIMLFAEIVISPVFEKAAPETAAASGKLEAYIGFVTFNDTT